MFTKIATIGVGVSNQDKALDFYVNTLGFEKVADQPMSETERWLEVAPPGAQTHIMLGLRGGMGGDKTGFTGYILLTDNIEATCEKPLPGGMPGKRRRATRSARVSSPSSPIQTRSRIKRNGKQRVRFVWRISNDLLTCKQNPGESNTST